jgi:acyl-coenzyme A thioesterase PaaI-like protein
MKPSTLRFGMNFWPPFLAAGIRVVRISDDWREVEVELRQGRFNMNYVGTHFGGSLFSMTDPFFMAMLSNILGRDYVVWDKASSIDFIRPGKGTVRAVMNITDTMLEAIRDNTPNEGDKYLPVWPVEIRDSGGDIVARIDKTIYIRRRKDERKRIYG